MTSYEEKTAALYKRQNEIRNLESELERESREIGEQLEILEEERVALSEKLSDIEEKELRKRLTVLGNLLTKERVHFANLSVCDEEPDIEVARGYCGIKITGKYSISIETHLIEEYGGPGFRINAKIKTKLPHVEEIVRDMFDQEGYKEPNYPAIPTSWSTDWDYGYCIALKKPVALDDE